MDIDRSETIRIEDVDFAQIYVDGETEAIVRGSEVDDGAEIAVEIHDHKSESDE